MKQKLRISQYTSFLSRLNYSVRSFTDHHTLLFGLLLFVLLGAAVIQFSFSTQQSPPLQQARAMVANPNNDNDSDGILNYYETDADTDRDGIKNYLDTDSDGDGCLDNVEGRNDPNGNGRKAYLDSTEKPNCP